MFFFFSSRRRHTRCSRDWSSTCALPISNPPAGEGEKAMLTHAPPHRKLQQNQATRKPGSDTIARASDPVRIACGQSEATRKKAPASSRGGARKSDWGALCAGRQGGAGSFVQRPQENPEGF